MTLSDRLMDDLKDAMRSGDAPRRDAIRMVRAAVKNAEIDWQRDATDGEVQQIIAREVRQREEAIEMFRNGGRDDLVASEQVQIEVLSEYLPEQLTEEEITAVVSKVVADLGATSMKEMGPVMRDSMQELKGIADGRVVNRIVRGMLSQ